MKRKEGFKMGSVCGEKFLMAEGEENMDFNKIISLNETAAFLWEAMGDADFTVEDLVAKLTEEYEVTADDARQNIEQFIEETKSVGVVE